MKKYKYYFSAFVFVIAAGFSAGADNLPDPLKIMEGATILGSAPALHLEIEMDIRTEKGAKSRSLEVFYLEEEEATRTLIQMLKPAFLRKMKFLTHAFADGNRARWLKTSSGIRRLSAADSGENLFDSDFTVEDLSEFDLERFSLSWLRQEEFQDHLCDVVQAVPGKDKSFYSRKVFYVERENGIIRGVDFFNVSGELVKQYRLQETKLVGDQIFPGRCEMVNLEKETSTGIVFRKIDPAAKIASRYFNKNNL